MLVGCSTKERLFEETEMTPMGEIYGDTFGSTKEVDQTLKSREIKDDVVDLSAYTRTATTELTTMFPELPNPKLSMYVHPHITNSNMPIPGYSTSFFMYKTVYFAMPGELRESK
jgi:conjugative transfer region lipoprotein (TIGR03751 family)